MRSNILYIAVVLILTACSNKKNNPVPTPSPGKAALSAPAQNAVCTTGTIVSDTKSNITFAWLSAGNADSYQLVVKNLLTADSTSQTTATTQQTLLLSRNTPYSWYIISKTANSNGTAQSDTWKFYNSGPGVVTYAPFPAAIISPAFGQTIAITLGTINLTWVGSAANNNTITNYDVYFGTTTTPPLLKSAIANEFVNGVSVTSGTTYYWKVITRDVSGNTSDSGLYKFSAN